MTRALCFLCLIFSFATSVDAQSDDAKKLRDLGKTLLDKNVSDSIKFINAEKFQQEFEVEVQSVGTDWVTTESLPFVSRLISNDKNTEVFTWTLKRAEDSYKSYGFVWTKNRKTGETDIMRLDDKSENVKNAETKNLGRNSWIGCVYYSIVDISKGKKPMFLLLGYGGHSPLIRRKVAEILTFNNQGEVQLGAPIFEKDNRKFNRVVLEFNAKATVAMKFDAQKQILFYDYLVPIADMYLGNPAFYGPNGSYDAFELKGGKLIFIKDADARNPDEGQGNRSKKVERKLPPRN